MAWRFGCPVDVAGAKRVFLGIDPIFDESALGADDPPAGPVEPANPARFDLEEDVVELEHHPAVAAAIDAFPGGGGYPCRHPPARAKSQLQGLIDQVRTPVVQNRSRRIGLPRQPRAERIGRRSSRRECGRPIAPPRALSFTVR